MTTLDIRFWMHCRYCWQVTGRGDLLAIDKVHKHVLDLVCLNVCEEKCSEERLEFTPEQVREKPYRR